MRIVFENIQDMDLTHVFECGQCFRWIPAGDGTGRQMYAGAAGSYAASVRYEDGRLEIDASGGDAAFWRNYFDLDTSYRDIKETLVRSEPGIAAAAEYGGGIRILNQDLFETVISFIISQNNNIPRIRNCIEALCRAYGDHIAEIEGRQIWSFPSPEALASADAGDLADLKLGYRCSYIRESATRYIECGPPAGREELLQYHGIGPKVANCIMLFGLRDTGAFPVDTWVKHIMNDMYGFDENDVNGMERFAKERFGRLAGYAQQYLFYYYRDRG